VFREAVARNVGEFAFGKAERARAAAAAVVEMRRLWREATV